MSEPTTPTARTIDIIVAPDGKCQLETSGFAGADCRAASRIIEQALGTSTVEQLKPEFYQQSTEHQPSHEQA